MSRPSVTIHFDGLAEVIRDALREQLAELRQATSPSPPASSDCLVAVSKAASHTGFTEATVRNWCNTGALKAEKVRRQWRIRLADLDAFCRGGCQGAAGTVDVEKEATAAVQRLLRPALARR